MLFFIRVLDKMSNLAPTYLRVQWMNQSYVVLSSNDYEVLVNLSNLAMIINIVPKQIRNTNSTCQLFEFINYLILYLLRFLNYNWY
jgi:hypothetical protein